MLSNLIYADAFFRLEKLCVWNVSIGLYMKSKQLPLIEKYICLKILFVNSV